MPKRVPRSMALPDGVMTVKPLPVGGTSAANRPFSIRSRCADSKVNAAGASITILTPEVVTSSAVPTVIS